MPLSTAPAVIGPTLLSIQDAAMALRASLASGHDGEWFDRAFTSCERSLSRLLSLIGRELPSLPAGGNGPSADGPSLEAAKAISKGLIHLGDRMRTEVFQVTEESRIKDAAAEFIERVYFDVLKPIFATYPELKPEQFTP